MAKRKAKGFTLLELIIVVIVIGILASVALPRYIQATEKGRVAEAKTILGAIRDSQIRYGTQYAVYTSNVSALDTGFQAPRYFATPVAVGSTNVTNDAVVIAGMVRNSTVENAGFGSYTINITAAGTLSITPSNLSYLL